jgi:hypothetical protein
MKQARAVAEAETGSSQRRHHLGGWWSLWKVKGLVWIKEMGDMMGDEETWPAG